MFQMLSTFDILVVEMDAIRQWDLLAFENRVDGFVLLGERIRGCMKQRVSQQIAAALKLQ